MARCRGAQGWEDLSDSTKEQTLTPPSPEPARLQISVQEGPVSQTLKIPSEVREGPSCPDFFFFFFTFRARILLAMKKVPVTHKGTKCIV